MQRMRPKDIPAVTKKLKAAQGNRCPICMHDLTLLPDKDCVLDHDHLTGAVRSVLCRNCNGIEGKIKNLATRAKRNKSIEYWLSRLLKYYEFHAVNKTGLLHPTYKTDVEKKVLKAKKERIRRATKKATKTVESK